MTPSRFWHLGAGLAAALLALALWLAAAAGQRQQERPNLPVYAVLTREKAMALTFDIGWGNDVIHEVLDVLRARHQKATFFLSGLWAARHQTLARAIAADGHELASHGQEHVSLTLFSREAIAKNLSDADRALRPLNGGKPLRWFRPPNGHWNSRVVEVARQLGYEEVVLWSIDPRDWAYPGPEAIVATVTREAFPGAILYFHASDSAPDTPKALPVLLDRLTQQGWRFVTVGELATLGSFSYRPPTAPRGGSGFR